VQTRFCHFEVCIGKVLLNCATASDFIGGYVAVDDILEAFKSGFGTVSMNDVLRVVRGDGNRKKRFEMVQNSGRWMIKATQGHSIQARAALCNLPIKAWYFRFCFA